VRTGDDVSDRNRDECNRAPNRQSKLDLESSVFLIGPIKKLDITKKLCLNPIYNHADHGEE